MSYPYYSSQNKPQYYDNNDTRVVVETETARPTWNWCAHGWALCALFVCPWCIFSWWCAFGGLTCAQSAYTDHKTGDYDRSRYKKSCAIGWTVVAIILGLAPLAAIIYLAVATTQLTSIFEQMAQILQGAAGGTTTTTASP